MTRISSQATRWYKKTYSALWLGLSGLMAVPMLFGNAEPEVVPAFPTVIIAIGVVGFVWMRWNTFRFVNEVWIEKYDLVIRNGKRKDRVAITQLDQVTVSRVSFRPRLRCIILSLKEPSKFGREIKFMRREFLWGPPAEAKLWHAHREAEREEYLSNTGSRHD